MNAQQFQTTATEALGTDLQNDPNTRNTIIFTISTTTDKDIPPASLPISLACLTITGSVPSFQNVTK